LTSSFRSKKQETFPFKKTIKRKMSSSRSTSTASTMPASFTVHVIDPLNRTGKIAVPSTYISTTKGLQDHFDAEQHGIVRRTVKDLSLCLLFLKGRCGADSYCNQIHVDADFIADVRKKSQCASNCCAKHGDPHAVSMVAASSADSVVDVAGRRLPLAQCARTDGLDNILRQAGNSRATIYVPASKVCRLQQTHRCKFGKDCKYVHVCREIGFFDAAAPQAAAVEVAPAPLTRFSRPLPQAVQGKEVSEELSVTVAAKVAAAGNTTPVAQAPPALTAWSSPAASASSSRSTPPHTARHSVIEGAPGAKTIGCFVDEVATELKSFRGGDVDDMDIDSILLSSSSSHLQQAAPLPFKKGTAAAAQLDFSALSMFVDDLSNAKLSPMFSSPAVNLFSRC